MKVSNKTVWSIIQHVIPWLVLIILLFYTYAKFFGHPYGFRWSGKDGEIIYVFAEQPEPTLKVGDRILKIGDVTWQEFYGDLRKVFFEGARAGEMIPITVNREGQIVNIDWLYPGRPTRAELLDQFISEWFLAYFFWLAGLFTIVVIRPKDERWLLMALFNFLTAIWLSAGSGVSSFHLWESAVVLRMAVLLSVPVYLHLHWLFPEPLGKLPASLVRSVYIIAFLFVIAQGLQRLPDDFFFSGFLLALVGSLILVLIHLWRQPTARRNLRLVFAAALLALIWAVIWQIMISLERIPEWLTTVGFLGLPLLPLAYLYAAFRRRLGGLELRVNRFFSVYLFVVLLGIIELPLITLLDQLFQISGESSAISLMSAVFTAAAFIWGYPVFERFVERRIFGIPLPSKQLLEIFSTRITTSISLVDLTRVLQDEVFPSLLVRQFAFLLMDQGSLQAVSQVGVRQEALPHEQDIEYLLARSGEYSSPGSPDDQPHPWIRLILPLKLGDQLIGFWLLGRRDPDDLYPHQEIPVLSSLANLTAIALSNIFQTERLTSMYEANISRYEQERLHLARDLHDSILNELAALPLRSDAPIFSARFQQAYDQVSEELREIVNNLRPPMLTFGLKLALEAFASNLRERNQEPVEILTDIQADGEHRYPLVVEGNLYRIVQEACENALRYAHAKQLSIAAHLDREQIELRVEDNGRGLEPDFSLKLNDLLANRHYGLVGMFERATVIGAELTIHSFPQEGTHIQVIWKSRGSDGE